MQNLKFFYFYQNRSLQELINHKIQSILLRYIICNYFYYNRNSVHYYIFQLSQQSFLILKKLLFRLDYYFTQQFFKLILQRFSLPLQYYTVYYYKETLMKIVSNLLDAIPIVCKIIYVISFILYIIGFIFTQVPLELANIPYEVIYQTEIYRLFFTYFSKGNSVLSIISIVVDFLWIRFFFTSIERTYSTVYFYTEIFVQNLILQLLFLMLGFVFLYLKFLTSFLICYGWTPLIILFVYKAVFRQSSDTIKILCFQVPKKHIPFGTAIICFIFAFDQFIAIFLAIFIAYLQFGILGRHFIKFPLGFYKKLESCIPNCIKNRQDFIKIQNTQSALKQQCSKASKKKEKQQNVQFIQQKSDGKQKKNKKGRKTGKNKSNNSFNKSTQLKDEIDNGKSTNQDDLHEVPKGINMQTNQRLQDDKI